MKVRDFLDKLSMSSNATVTVLDARNEKEWRMFYDQMRQCKYEKWASNENGTVSYSVDVGALKLNTFSVRNNEITIYAE